jgi:hypothetical protein
MYHYSSVVDPYYNNSSGGKTECKVSYAMVDNEIKSLEKALLPLE